MLVQSMQFANSRVKRERMEERGGGEGGGVKNKGQ